MGANFLIPNFLSASFRKLQSSGGGIATDWVKDPEVQGLEGSKLPENMQLKK